MMKKLSFIPKKAHPLTNCRVLSQVIRCSKLSPSITTRVATESSRLTTSEKLVPLERPTQRSHSSRIKTAPLLAPELRQPTEKVIYQGYNSTIHYYYQNCNGQP